MFLIPEKAKKKLIEQGYGLNVYFYEEHGETIQFGEVGQITDEYTKIGDIKFKKGDAWKEILDTKNWSIKIQKYDKSCLSQRAH